MAAVAAAETKQLAGKQLAKSRNGQWQLNGVKTIMAASNSQQQAAACQRSQQNQQQQAACG
jgi:hypothetical protein